MIWEKSRKRRNLIRLFLVNEKLWLILKKRFGIIKVNFVLKIGEE